LRRPSAVWHKLWGIPYPHQLGGTDPDITDANKSVASLTCPSDVDGLVVIGVDCALVIPNVHGGEVTFALATALVAVDIW